jgi:S-formylglutathione hydrolase FrmB
VRFLLILIAVTAVAQPAALTSEALIQEQTHRSQVMAGPRAYRVFLPPAYAKSRTTRYPVIYWFHGYEPQNQARDAALAAYVARPSRHHCRLRPRDTTGQFPLYFPELIERIDQTLRTVPDRDHRAVTGSGAGGFLAIWQAAKCPDLVASASSFGAPPEAPAGPQGFRRRYRTRRPLPHARSGPCPSGGRRFLPR